MQAGVTGINAVRIYSPVKQVKDRDPEGEYIRRYSPELEHVAEEYIAEPDKMSASRRQKCGCKIGRGYPVLIVEQPTACRQARRKSA